MSKSLSMAFSSVVGGLAPILGGILFFFTIIGVFGLWFAIGGLLIAVILALVIISRIPVEGERA
jgi:hypothetical protein